MSKSSENENESSPLGTETKNVLGSSPSTTTLECEGEADGEENNHASNPSSSAC